MGIIGAHEARTHWSRILYEVEAGGSVTVTGNGRPIARIVPVESRSERVRRLFDELQALRESIPTRFTHSNIREMIDEGRV
jgi:prevent-host-death family protein